MRSKRSSSSSARVARRGASHVVELADHLEVLEAGQVLVDRRVLAGQADLGAQRRGVAHDVEPGDARAAPVGLSSVARILHRGGLARAVGAEQAEHAARRRGEVHAAQRAHRAVRLLEPLDDDRIIGHVHGCCRVGSRLSSAGRRLFSVRPPAYDTTPVDNAQIADRLDAFASLLELAEANPYTTRAYRRAAETIRGAAFPVAELVRSGRARELRGIGPGIEARLRELVETGADRRAGRARARARARSRRPRPLPRAQREALGRARAGARRPHRRRASRGGGRGPAADGAGYRAEDRGAAPRGARPRGRAASPARASAQPRLGARRRHRGRARRRGGRRCAAVARLLRAAGGGLRCAGSAPRAGALRRAAPGRRAGRAG